MSEKIKRTGKSAGDDDERYNNRYDDQDDDNDFDDDDFDNRGRSSNRGGGSKFEKMYGVIDAFIDQIDMPKNRLRALKYGIRALGELLSETGNNNRGGGNRGRSNSGGSSSGERGVSKSHRK